MADSESNAPGWPGIPARWTSSAKTGIGTAISAESRLWFTLSHGIVNEVYYPRIDQACVRDIGLIITDGCNFFSEEKRHAKSDIEYLAPGVPAYHLTNTCSQGRYRIEKIVLTDPVRDSLLQRIRLLPLTGILQEYRLFVLLAPHLANRGDGNTAWVGEYKGVPMLFAQRGECALALACGAPWLNRSVGFVGFSDGWQNLVRYRVMTWNWTKAVNGNVALVGEVDIQACGGQFLLALGFGRNAAEAGHRARSSLMDGFDVAQAIYIRQWQQWQQPLAPLGEIDRGRHDLYRVSTAMLRVHTAKCSPGGMVASLSIPWGFAKGDEDLGGYHLVWPRDLVESAGGLLAAGAEIEAVNVIDYLRATQEADGHWPQNMWLDGTPYWNGIQLDETAFPILLLGLAQREGVLERPDLLKYWPMVRQAAGFLVRSGPVTQMDRWEEDPGYSPFTLSVTIAALIIAADLADINNETGVGRFLRETADSWNACIERWMYVTGTDLAKQVGVEGYYVRIAPPEQSDAASPAAGFVTIKNRPLGKETMAAAAHIVSPDALALVRFGLRAAGDSRIVNTVRVIDALLEVETPSGHAWRRYNGDGYGEHDDGEPFDGSGTGRPWPLLTGERAHYELAGCRRDLATTLAETLESFANEGGLIPEQIWDAADIPDKGLYRGRASGSAMPLLWAHAEYVKLLRSLRDDRVFDMPPQVAERYAVKKTSSTTFIWRPDARLRSIPAGSTLRIATLARCRVHWSLDAWRTIVDAETVDTGLGLHVADLATARAGSGERIEFTFYWEETNHWEARDFSVQIG